MKKVIVNRNGYMNYLDLGEFNEMILEWQRLADVEEPNKIRILGIVDVKE